jgi:prepilin-type N-terminal cleavage/methylation domain-containing protein
MWPRRSAGVTLVELLVVLGILGIMAGLVGLAWQPGRWRAGDSRVSLESIVTVRRRALESGRSTQAVVTIDGRTVRVLALPDGRILGAEQFDVNPLNGAVDARSPH